MKMKKWFVKALPWLIVLMAWLTCMWYATVAGARQLYRDWQKQSWYFTEAYCFDETERIYGEKKPELGRMEYLELPLFGGISDWYTDPTDHMDISCYYLDANGKSTLSEGSYAVINYWTKVEVVMNHCYMDMDEVPQAWKDWLTETLEKEYPEYEAPYVVLHGYFEGERFVPLKAEWTTEWTPGDLDNETLDEHVQFTTIFDHTDGVSQPELLITRGFESEMAWDIGFALIDTVTDPVRIGDIEFDSCQAFAEAWFDPDESLIDAYCGYDWSDEPSFSNLRQMVFVREAWDLQQIGASDAEDVNFVCCSQVIRCYPLRSAMLQLIPVYLVSLALVLLTFTAVRRRYIKSIRSTLHRGKGYETEMPMLHGWKELAQLENCYVEATDTLRRQTQELTRLDTALKYAGDAEVNRRKLVSDITHELKTPLAVIHSYAEGLSEGIAPEKREKYLSIIMEEAEKMDAMVLSMLDLSRLEAGKVRLSQEAVCLMEMAKAVFEKLEPLYKEKGLTVHFLGKPFHTQADRERMEQVITNLATNAIKYCSPEGSIVVTIKQEGKRTCFAIENDCYRLPEKALMQIWDSFYREETSRTTKGTGLGLPIVKAIVELHGGTCQAKNTDAGVEFQFTLPE